MVSGTRGLAARVGVSHTAVAGWLRDDRWPFGRGPWDGATVEKIKRWMANTLKSDPGAMKRGAGGGGVKPGELSLERKADISLKLKRAETLQFELEKKKKLYHLVSECDSRRARQVQEVREELVDRAPARIATRVVGRLNLVEVRTIIEDELRAICNRFAEMTSGE